MIFLTTFITLVFITIFHIKRRQKYLIKIIIILLISILFQSIKSIPNDYIAVARIRGFIYQNPLQSGIHLTTPVTDTILFPTNIQKINHQVNALTKEGFPITIKLFLTYKIIEKNAVLLYKNVGTDFVEKMIKPDLNSNLRKIAALNTSDEIAKLERSELKLLLLNEMIKNHNTPKYIQIKDIDFIH